MRTKKSIFLDTFGDTPFLRVIEFFITYPQFDYTKSFVAKEAGISRITIEKIWKELITKGVIIKARKIGNSQTYRLNKEDSRVKVLMKTALDLSKGYLQSLKKPLKQKHNIAIPA